MGKENLHLKYDLESKCETGFPASWLPDIQNENESFN
jgi:hypothetical protein